MTPDQQRKFNTIVGGLFIGAGILAWFMAFYFAATKNPPAPTPVLGTTTVDLNSCRATLSEMGYQAQAKENEITAFESLTSDPKEQLERASTAVLVCKMTLQSFCMGEGCERPGLSFVLRRPVEAKQAVARESSEAAPSAPAQKPKGPPGKK